MKFFKFFILGAVFVSALFATPSSDTVVSAKTSLEAQKEYYKDMDFVILDASETTIDGAAAIILTFSTPLQNNLNLDRLITIFNVDKSRNVDGAWEISRNRREAYIKYLEPRTDYVVQTTELSASRVRNIVGKSLNITNTKIAKITTRDMQPLVGFVSSASLLPSDFTEGLPITTLNVNSVDIDFIRLDTGSAALLAMEYLFGKSSTGNYNIDYIVGRGGTLAYSGRFNLNNRKNVKENIMLPIKDIKALQKSGIYLAVMQQPAKYDQYILPATIFSITDVGVIVHKTNENYEIFTQNLLNGNALGGVTIRLIDNRGNVIANEKTDGKGYLKLPLHMEKNAVPKALMAQNGDKLSFLYLDSRALDLSEYSISGRPSHNKTLFAFGPRDLYRGGERVFVNALLRDKDGNMLPDQPIRVTIVQGDNKEAKTFTWQGKNGFYSYAYDLPDNAVSGRWKFQFDLGDENIKSYSFNVEDFMPEKMAIEAKLSETPLPSSSDVVFDIIGRYLYGAPAANNQLIGSITSRLLTNAVSSLPSFHFGSVREASNLDRYLGNTNTALDKDGKAKVTVQNAWSDINSPINVIFEASLMESGGRPVTRTFTQAVWPNEELPAIRPNFAKRRVYSYVNNRYEDEFSVDYDSRAEFEIIFTNAKGERLENRNLQVSLLKERRDYYSYLTYDGWQYDYRQTDIPLETNEVSIEKGKSAIVGFDVEWGSYVVEVTDKSTGAVSSIRFWAGYSWQDSIAGGATAPEQVKLKIDKPSYKSPDVAKVTVEPNEDGSGYLVAETNEGILWWKNIDVKKGANIFEVPIAKNWVSHDIYISAVVIRQGSRSLHSTPKRAFGIMHLPLDRSDRKIDVNLDIPEKIEPKQKIKVRLKADISKVQQGKKVTAIISAVDSGILSITNFQTPNPYDEFFARRGFYTDIYDIYGNLIEGSGKNAKLRFGGDVALEKAGKKPLSKILLVAMQSNLVTLNEKGEADVEFEIPDFNGELRFMTQVWSDEEYGGSEKKAIVAAPIIVELNHPRFLAGNDKSTLALDINNLSGKNQNLKVEIKSYGFVVYEGKDSQQISLDNKQKKIISVPVSALGSFGGGTIVVKATSADGKVVERNWTIGVRPAYPAQSFSLTKELKKNDSLIASEFENGYKELDQRATEAAITISAYPPLNIARAIKELFAYPYGCVEQTTSGIYPLIYTSAEQLHSLGIETSSNEERRANVEKGIARLLGMQKTNGSFGFWSSDDEEMHWASVYVTDFLLRAKEQGYAVPQNALNAAIDRLQTYLNSNNLYYGYYSASHDYTIFAIRSYAAFILAKEQKANLGNLRRLYELANEKQSPLALMQLGIALKLMGDNERADATFKKALSYKTSEENRWYGDYGSNLRNEALMLSLMFEHDLFPNERGKRLVELSGQINKKSYFSTQERNAIFLAGRNFLGANEPAWEAVLDMNGKKENLKGGAKTYERGFSYQEIDSVQSIKNLGDQTLFASVSIAGYPTSTPKAVSNNINITRAYYTISGAKTTLEQLRSGDMVIVVLDVTTNRVRVPDALVVDLLPAGLELENQNLGISSANLQNTEALTSNRELMNKIASTKIVHQEFRDDRYVAAIDINGYSPATLVYLARAVSPGIYTVPPPYVESMYNPEMFAVGETPPKLTVR